MRTKGTLFAFYIHARSTRVQLLRTVYIIRSHSHEIMAMCFSDIDKCVVHTGSKSTAPYSERWNTPEGEHVLRCAFFCILLRNGFIFFGDCVVVVGLNSYLIGFQPVIFSSWCIYRNSNRLR